jgi:alkylation response protein AidB-like acyl-CoA dehydrogenase
VLDALHEAQMFRTMMPRSVGGAELDPATHAQVVAAIAEGDASVAGVAQAACPMASAYLEPRVGGDLRDPRAVFVRLHPGRAAVRGVPVDGGWSINGTWTFGSGNRSATWLEGMPAVRREGDQLKHPDGRPVERTMIFPSSAARWTTRAGT